MHGRRIGKAAASCHFIADRHDLVAGSEGFFPAQISNSPSGFGRQKGELLTDRAAFAHSIESARSVGFVRLGIRDDGAAVQRTAGKLDVNLHL